MSTLGNAHRAELDALIPSIARLDHTEQPPAPGEYVVFLVGDQEVGRQRVLDLHPHPAGGWAVELEPEPRTPLDVADRWNLHHPPGTRVRAYPGTRDDEPLVTRTRTAAWLVSGQPVVSVDGYAGGIALTHVDPIGDDQ